MLAGAAVLLAALLMVSWLGVKEITQRFSTMKAMEVASGKRATMRKDTWQIFLAHPWMGTGLGTLQTVFPLYETQYDGRVINHSHNDYVEALADTGVAGGLCCALFLGMLLFHSLTAISDKVAPFSSVLNLSGLVACIGFLVHSFVDFNLHLPANALLFFLMATLATSPLNKYKSGHRPSRMRHRTTGKP
jgi:O-antigen ligase